MAILPILEAPDPRLRVISTPVERSAHADRDMLETMYDAPGIGLAVQ